MTEGMDFPNNIETNAYRLDNVTEIHWAFYTLKQDEKEEVTEVSSDVEADDMKCIAQAAEHDLLKQGSHALLEENRRSIWVFCLSEIEKENALQVLTPDNFECPHSGCAVSSDLAMTSAQGTTVPKSTNTSKFWQQFGGGVGEPNTQAFNANTNASARPSMTSLIYQKLMLALSQSMVYTLSKERWFLQIGASICLDARTLGDNIFEALQAGAAAKGSSTISCDFRWLSSGSLLLFLSRNTGRRLCTISHALPRTRESSVLKAGELIILSPSGTVGQYYGVEGSARNHFMHRSIEATKTVVYNWLVRRGTAMPQNLQWVFVRLGVDDDQDVSKESTRNLMDARLSLWPAHLCLCKDSGFPAELSKDEDLIGTSNGTIDPLDKAQSWFLGKGTRVEALETRRRKDLAEIEEAKQVEGKGAEDRSPLYQHQNSQNVTPRDVSGIYPTPPDGLPSGLHDPSTNIESQSSGVDDEMSATPTAERMSGPLEETGNDELFGEMDIDMFASNGLTEDDFNFFDEPDANGKTDPVYRGDHFGLGETVEATTAVSPPIEFSSPSHEEDHHGDISTHLVAGRQEPFQSPENAFTEELKDMSKLREKGISVNEPRDVGKDLIINEEALKGPLLDVKSLLPSSGQALGASFNTVTFPEVSSELDGKYALRGRYGFDPGDRPETSELEKQLSSPDRLLPQTGTLRLEWSTNEVDMDTGNEGLHHKCVGSCIDLQVIDSTDETPSTSSSVFSKNDENEEPNTVVLRQISCKRKRRPSETPDLLATPLSSTALTEVSEEPEDRGIVSDPALFSPNTGKYAAGFLGSGMDVGDSNVTTMTGNNRVFIQVAQMVADQAVSSTKISQGPLERLSEPTLAERTPLRQFVEEILTDWSSRAGKVSKRCTLKDLVGLDDQDFSNVGRDHVNNISQRMQKPSYPTRASSAAGQMVSKLPSPYACVQRSGTLIDIAAPALRFWEELSLAPSHNGKDVTAFCIYPTERGVQDEISTFLTMVKGAYQSCKLGLHHLGSGPAKQANGLIPTPMDFLRPQESPPDLYRACEDLGSWLGKTKFQGRNTVIYMVNPSSHDASLPWLCTAFLKLFNAYSTMAKDQNIATPNDLVLQIIPSDLIYSETQISLPSPATYRRLAFEVYDRCGPNESGEQRRRPEYACAPSMRLAKAIPKTVDFRLTPENAPLSLQSDNCLHVAYTWKKGEDWLTASWTDNLGVLSWTACYCFASKDDAPWHAFSEIAKEIWETSLDMLRPRNGPWRLVLCKDGGVYKHEMDAWQSVVLAINKTPLKFPVLFTFLTIEVDPLLQFPAEHHEIRGFELPLGSLETPENTPQASTPSPDISGIGSTPGGGAQASTPPANTAFGDHDAEARLVDVTDETWGVVMSHSVSDVCIPSDFCPALVSGYLLKRCGPREEDGVMRIGVNVIRGQKPHRPLLKAVLGMYRNLGLLARIRGIVDPVKSMDPYHVAVARKAQATLTATMRYGET